MSRYIDADFEIAHYTSMTTDPTPDVTEKDKRNSLIILDALRMAKSIDIVRCGECIYWKNSLCQAWHRVIPKDGYCSIGERDRSTQTETQNSNLTFEKRTMRDCYNCRKYETEGECVECKFEPKDEPQKEEWYTYQDEQEYNDRWKE